MKLISWSAHNLFSSFTRDKKLSFYTGQLPLLLFVFGVVPSFFTHFSSLFHIKTRNLHWKKYFLQTLWEQSTICMSIQSKMKTSYLHHYRYNDHLLCHDDELEGRRIAFIMYFVKGDLISEHLFQIFMS